MKNEPRESGGLALFETAIGTCGVAWTSKGIRWFQLPEKSVGVTRERLFEKSGGLPAGRPSKAMAQAITKVRRHFEGKKSDLSGIPLDFDGLPEFHQKVYRAARAVGPGEVATYGQLAALAGSPGGARAVGQAMSKNPFPVIIPCHRIIAAGGKGGGFSAFGGTETKAKLLAIEGVELGPKEKPKKTPSEGSAFDLDRATRELSLAEPALGRLIAKAVPFEPRYKKLGSPFESLLEAIVHQQLNGTAAKTIMGRVRALGKSGLRLTPEEVPGMPDEVLRGAGLSGAKTLAVRDLAAKTLDGTVPVLTKLKRMSDDEIVERLTSIRGIGRWTVEMMLIFRLGRPDVMPIDDYGIRKGYQKLFKMNDLPKPQEVLARSERWRPWRSVASWYLWRALEM